MSKIVRVFSFGFFERGFFLLFFFFFFFFLNFIFLFDLSIDVRIKMLKIDALESV